MITQKINFTDSDGYVLSWILSKPREWVLMPLVISCSWFGSSKDSQTNLAREKSLLQKWFALYRFDFFGHGESEWEFADITLSKAIDSIIHAHTLLQTMWFSHIWLAWSSFGWCSALNASAILWNKICGLFCKCPVSDYVQKTIDTYGHQWIQEYKQKWYFMYENNNWFHKIYYSFYEDMQFHNVHKLADQIVVPTMIVHWDADQVVSVQQSLKTQQLITDCTLKIVAGANHRFSQPQWAFEELNNYFIEFFVKVFDENRSL